METLKIMNSRERKNLEKEIRESFGCTVKLDYEVFMSEKKKIFLVSRDIGKVDLAALRINNVGLYFGDMSNGLRLSVEGSQLIGPSSENTVELDEGMAARWLAGENIELKTDKNTFVIVKHNKDFLGSGKLTGERLVNFLPKERRLSS